MSRRLGRINVVEQLATEDTRFTGAPELNSYALKEKI